MELDNLKAKMNELGRDYIEELTRQLLLADKKATGNLIKSLSYDVVEVLDNVLLRIKASDYLIWVDRGRRPGKQPPSDKIKKWVQVRKIQFRNKKGRFMTYDSTAFLIARSIGKKGIKPTYVLKKTIDSIMKTKSEILGKAAAKDIEKDLRKILINL